MLFRSDENGVPIVLSAIPKLPLPMKPTPARTKTAPRRAAAIAAKANITTMTSELQHDDHSAAPSPEQSVVMAVRASRRNRVNTASPEPAKAVVQPPIKEEVGGPARRTSSSSNTHARPVDPPKERPVSAWTCSHCHRPEAVLDDKRRFDGPLGRPNLCSDCAPLFPVETAKSKEVTPPPFQDVASPDSTFSDDGPAPASTSLAAPTPSPVVHRPGEVQSPRVPLTPSRPGVALQRVTSGSTPPLPEWVKEVLMHFKQTRPHDRLDPVYRPNASGDERTHWKMKCLDCPGKVYSCEPSNLEIHMKNRKHIDSVNKRLQGRL